MQSQVNPIQLIQMIKNGQNPQQLMMSVLESQMKGTPMGDNLIRLARENRSAEIEQIARNLYGQQCRDFDKQQIIDGGDVDGEMAQGAVTLHSGDGQARLLHIVEHLGEDGEVKGGGAETQHPAHRPHADEDEERHAHRHGQPEIEGLFRTPGQGTAGDVSPAFEGVYH